MHYNWDWAILLSAPYPSWLLYGLAWTILISLTAWCVALGIGTCVGVFRTLSNRFFRGFAAAYVSVFRNIPALVQLFLWFYVVPDILPHALGLWVKRDMYYPQFTTAVVCLGFYTSSRVAEQVRAGIQSVPEELVAAAKAAGMRVWQVYVYVQLPLAYRTIVPPLTSEFLGLFKNSSLALTIGMLELTAQSRRIANDTAQSIEAFTAATLLYLLVNGVVLLLMRRLEAAGRIQGMMARASAPAG